jgi:hypothetical protein
MLRRYGAGDWVGRAAIAIAVGLVCAAPSFAAGGEAMFKGQGGESTFKGKIARDPVAYVLNDPAHNVVYRLDNQKLPKAFAAQDVVVVGVLDRANGTIKVDDIVRDLPAKVREAKSVAIVCDACPRGAAKAKKAALEQMLDWSRFRLVSDPKQADLVFLFSANPYLGDYATRDGPDKRPVAVDITYLNVIDPRTGANLWGDYRQEGSWFVSSATRDLIVGFREQLEMDENPVEEQAFVERHLVPRRPPDAVDPYQGK